MMANLISWINDLILEKVTIAIFFTVVGAAIGYLTYSVHRRRLRLDLEKDRRELEKERRDIEKYHRDFRNDTEKDHREAGKYQMELERERKSTRSKIDEMILDCMNMLAEAEENHIKASLTLLECDSMLKTEVNSLKTLKDNDIEYTRNLRRALLKLSETLAESDEMAPLEEFIGTISNIRLKARETLATSVSCSIVTDGSAILMGKASSLISEVPEGVNSVLHTLDVIMETSKNIPLDNSLKSRLASVSEKIKSHDINAVLDGRVVDLNELLDEAKIVIEDTLGELKAYRLLATELAKYYPPSKV